MPRSSPTHPQAWRQLQLRKWLLDGRRFNATQAAEELEVSRRTIMKDLEHMRAFGHAIEYNTAARSCESLRSPESFRSRRSAARSWQPSNWRRTCLSSSGLLPLPVHPSGTCSG